MNLIIKLSRPEDYRAEEGARFRVEFERTAAYTGRVSHHSAPNSPRAAGRSSKRPVRREPRASCGSTCDSRAVPASTPNPPPQPSGRRT
jgi:hypothetical protein